MEEDQLQNIFKNTATLPNQIALQFQKIEELDNKVKESMKMAEDAKNSAQTAYNESAGFFNRKTAIESLQSAANNLSQAQISAAEAQKISFQYQSELGRITQGLFGLGISNVAANRAVVRELTLKLKGASKEKLNDLARQEILNVIKQLKEQEDLMNQQSKLAQRIFEEKQKNEAQDAIIETQGEKDKEHDKLFQNLYQENEQLKHNIEENHISIQKLSKNVNELFEIKTDKKVTIISLVISIVAVVLACAKFFI